jgi:hypothetical protein
MGNMIPLLGHHSNSSALCFTNWGFVLTLGHVCRCHSFDQHVMDLCLCFADSHSISNYSHVCYSDL